MDLADLEDNGRWIMKIRAQLRCMAKSEIAEMIPKETIARIKQKDPSPLFQAFIVGHEGEARGNLVGVGNIVKRWFRSAIEQMYSKINAGIQLFHGHGATNETSGRVAIGEIVGKKLASIKDRLSTIVACYIYPDFRHLPLDVASIEADIDLRHDRTHGYYISDVGAVTAIALGNSKVDTPGFPGATLLGQLQAFAKHKSQEETIMDLSIEDVRAFLRTEKVKPSDLFSMDDMAVDPVVRGIAEERVKERIAGEFARRKDAEEKLETLKTSITTKDAEYEKQINKLKIDGVKTKIDPLFDKRKTDRKLDDKQIKFVKSRLAKFEPSNADSLEKDFDLYLDKEIDEYAKIAKDVFGIETKKEETKTPGSEPAESKPPVRPEEKYIDPKTNPMIRTE